MHYPPGPFYSSSYNPPSSSSDVVSETVPASSEPSHTTPAFPFQPVDAGLGILTQFPESHLRPHALLEQYPPDWSENLVPSTLPWGCSLNTTHLSPGMFYEPYSGSEASASPLSYCGPQTMSISSSRGSAFDYGASHDLTSTQSHRFWPSTPDSGADIRVTEDPDSDTQHASYSGSRQSASLSLYAPIEQSRMDRFPPNVEGLDGRKTAAPEKFDPDVDFRLPSDLSALPNEVISKWIEENAASPNTEKRQFSAASGLECTICGAQFTRRSNCREHMKRHDPNGRKAYTCEDCGKSLGRKTDLKRHIDSVHRAARRFACEQCGYCFSRQDTLIR
ncbi:hypothetical protein BJX61DRAFT_533226 [Aspergillus egyptiacus]|nr:hypothetical protein BJX61DRAFT_533226 [Aspergillus egyptiacus]